MTEIFEFVINEPASIQLPDFLIERLGLAKSIAVSLFPSSSKSYLMPCLSAAGILNEECEKLEETDDLSDEEIVEMIKVGRKFDISPQLPVTFCPLTCGLMTLTQEVLQKLDVKTGDKISVIRPYNFHYLCNPDSIKEYDNWRIL